MKRDNVAIQLRDVTVSYRLKAGFMKWSNYYPFRNISFDIKRGETLGVIGRNGVGKSSLLRLIAGITEPDNGTVINHDVSVLLLSLGAGFLQHLTGRENVILSGMLMGMSKNQVESCMDQVIEYSELTEFIDQPLRAYSSGMRSRIGFATAMLANPDVLLIDEILGVGDEKFKRKSTRTMKSLIASDKTIVLVSHQVPLIKELCDRVIWLDSGKVRYVGETNLGLELYLKEKNRRQNDERTIFYI